jgi:peptidyl-prolyl cis-trans isomerase C
MSGIRIPSVAIVALCVVGATAAQVNDEQAIAHVGPAVVPAGDLKDLMRENATSGDLRKLTEALTPEGRQRLLQGRLDMKLLALSARDEGLDRRPAVRRALDRAADAVLAQAAIDERSHAIDLAPAALREYYDAHAQEFRVGDRIKARHIVVKTRQEAEDIERQLAAGADFGAIAGARNTDNSRPKNGELGSVSRGVMVKPFEAALFRLKAGERSGIVQSSFGFHIIEAEQVDPGHLQAFDAVKDRIRQTLIGTAVERLKAAAAAKYPVSIDRDVLNQIGRSGDAR